MSTPEPPPGPPDIPPAPPPPPPPPQQQVVYVQQPQQRGNGMAVAGFVCGLIGLILFWFFWIGIPLAILGIVFSAIGRRRANREPDRSGGGLAMAGLVLGIIGLLLAILWIALIAALISESDDILDELEDLTVTE